MHTKTGRMSMIGSLHVRVILVGCIMNLYTLKETFIEWIPSLLDVKVGEQVLFSDEDRSCLNHGYDENQSGRCHNAEVNLIPSYGDICQSKLHSSIQNNRPKLSCLEILIS
jgi:hypothetical protein